MIYDDLDLKSIRENTFKATQAELSDALDLAYRTYQNYELNGVPVSKRPLIKSKLIEHAKNIGVSIQNFGVLEETKKTRLSFNSELEMLMYIANHQEDFFKLEAFKPFLAKMTGEFNLNKMERRLKELEKKVSELTQS